VNVFSHASLRDVRVRHATAGDHSSIVALVPRLRAFGEVPFRTAEAHDRAERSSLEHALANPSADSVINVAELDDVGVVGVAYAHTAIDFSGERHGHLSILAVSEHAEGRGVGRALIEATEAWARGLEYRLLTLNVFAANEHAKAVYERVGFAPDMIRYTKDLTLPASHDATTSGLSSGDSP
jgi:GNAT superfamily N-acetyltransferase